MALWGISTQSENWANSYAIPKFLNDEDRNNTPHNCFADDRGWIYRRYQSDDHSGLGTIYTDEVLIPVSGLNTTADQSIKLDGVTITGSASSVTHTGIAPATPVAVFFEDPNQNSNISVAAGGTTKVAPAATAYVHLVYNENVFVSTGTTIGITPFNINNGDAGSVLTGYAVSAVGDVTVFGNTGIPTTSNPGDGTLGAGDTTGSTGGEFQVYNLTGLSAASMPAQITNRVSFAFTAPAATALKTANDVFAQVSAAFTSATKVADGGVGVGTTTFFVDASDLTGVVAGVSSVTINTNQGIGKTNAPIASVGSTSFTVGRPGVTTAGFSTIRDQIPVGVGATITFSNLTAATKLKINMDYGIVGTVTSFYDSTAAVKTFINAGVATRPNAYIQGIDRQVGGAGTFMSGSFLENPSTLTVDGSVVVGLGTTALLVGFADTTF